MCTWLRYVDTDMYYIIHKIISQQITASYVCWSHIEKERIGTPCDHRENGGETRKRKAEGTDDPQSCFIDGHRQDSVSDLGSQGQSSLERHDRQRLRAGHLRRRRCRSQVSIKTAVRISCTRVYALHMEKDQHHYSISLTFYLKQNKTKQN